MKHFQRSIVAILATTLAGAGLAAVTVAPASAAVIGNLVINPSSSNPASGGDSTLFGGSLANANCPTGTDSAFFDIKGDDIGFIDETTTSGSGEIGYLGASTNNTGTGAQEFIGASIANLKTTNAGSFVGDGAYQIRFVCYTGPTFTDSYEMTMNYLAGPPTSWTISTTALSPRNTTTALTAAPTGPVEQGTSVTLTADVTPTTGADDPVGSVEFFTATTSGTTSLGIDNTLTADGVGSLSTASLPVGSNSITAVYSPGAGFAGSTSDPVVVEVTPVAARPTTSTLTVAPVTGAAFQAVTLTCDVSAGTFSAVGTANFLDNGVLTGSAPVSNGTASITKSSFGPGAHSFVCNFVGTAPYTDSTSNTVTATYTQTGALDEQTVTVEIPVGAITITTPYTPASPLFLGVAVLDNTDSTYSASATFNDIVITDTRAGNVGWTASVVAGDFINGTSSFGGDRAGLTELIVTQVPGNALQAADVTVTNNPPVTPGLGVPREFARYAAGKPTGTADLTGTFGIDQVPTSVQPGLFTSTVTFTAV